MMKTRQVSFLCHPYHRGGVTRWMADAAVAFAEKGWSVYFLTVKPETEFYSGAGRETLLEMVSNKSATLKIISKAVGREFEFGTHEYRVDVYRALLQQLPDGVPVIISDAEDIWAAATCSNRRLPVVGVLHADEPMYYNLAAKYGKYVAALACVSERVKRTALERIKENIGPKELHTIPCGIYMPEAVGRENSDGILKLAYVGRLTKYQKRIGDLVKIAARLKENNVAFHLDIVGDGVDRHELELAISESGVKNEITLHGWVAKDRVTDLLNQSDMLLMTSDFEGTPIAMMEAFAAGCGMVGTRVSGIEDYEFHSDAQACLAIYDVGDIEGAVGCLKKMSAISAQERFKAARRLAMEEFSMDVCLRRYEQLISSMPTAELQQLSSPEFSAFDRLYSKVLARLRALKVRMK